MAIYDIETVTAAELITVQKMNEEWQGNISFLLNPPACRVYNNAGLTHTSTGNWQKLSGFNSERYDTDSMHSTSVSSERITINTAGLYLVTAAIEWAANATGLRGLQISLNGSTPIVTDHENSNGASFGTAISVSTVYKFTAGQYFEVHGFQNSGGNLGIASSANWTPEVSATWIGIG